MTIFDRAVKALNDVDEAIDHLPDNEAYVTALESAGLLAPDLPEPDSQREWGISYSSNHGGLASEEIWVTFDTEEQAHKGMEHFKKSERRGTLSNLKLHARHVTEWEEVDD